MADEMTTRAPSGAALFLLIAGFSIWASAFVWLYGALTIGCAFGWEHAMLGRISALRLALALIWAAHVVATILLLAWTQRRARARTAGSKAFAGFVLPAAWGATLSAVVATIWIGAPLLETRLCI
ncbi:MAG TPA: hypothetical protein VIG55_06605 [Methylosinus sp.]|jgi:hypothetical protein